MRNKKCNLLVLGGLYLTLSGCATVEYDSACHELSVINKSSLSKMIRGAKKAKFERHVVLLETGTAMGSHCQSYYINAEEYNGLPESIRYKCNLQGMLENESYCMLYSLDGEVQKQLVE